MAAPGAGIYMRGARPPCTPQRLAYDVASHSLIDIAGSSCVSPRTEHRLKLSHTHILGMMKRHGLAARAHRVHPLLLLLAAVLLFAAMADGIRPGPDDADAKPAVQRARPGQAPGAPAAEEKDGSGFLQEEVYGTGSSLPDCTHACGACKPCNRVMVSFKCSIAEPCPMVYRCMCKGKCYPVPSS